MPRSWRSDSTPVMRTPMTTGSRMGMKPPSTAPTPLPRSRTAMASPMAESSLTLGPIRSSGIRMATASPMGRSFPPDPGRGVPDSGRDRRLPDEVELPPGGPPIGGPRDDRAAVDDLDSRQEAVLLHVIRGDELHPDLHRRRRNVRRDSFEIPECGAGSLFDHLPGASRRQMAGAVTSQRALYRDRGQPVAEESAGL